MTVPVVQAAAAIGARAEFGYHAFGFSAEPKTFGFVAADGRPGFEHGGRLLPARTRMFRP